MKLRLSRVLAAAVIIMGWMGLHGQAPRLFLETNVRSHPAPAVRFSSDLTVYDEGLFNGRLVGRYWSAIGRIRAEKDISSKEFESAQADSFHLEIGGNTVSGDWVWVSAQQQKADRPDQRHLVVELKHKVEPITLRLHTVLDGTPILTRWMEIRNTSRRPLPLSGVAPFAGRLWLVRGQPAAAFQQKVDHPFTIGYFRHDKWGEEGDFGWQTLPRGAFDIVGRNGKSGWGNPFFIAHNEANGEYFVCALAWSGNWTMGLNRESRSGEAGDESLFFRARPYAADAVMRVIAPGEMIASPAVHLGHLTGDLDTVVQAMHEHVRRSVLPPQPERRAQLIQDNHWGYLSGIEEETGLKGSIDAAAAVGVELYIHDAGWYGRKRGDWNGQVGDWQVGPWLPNGLKPVVDYAHQRGLLFGLWMEPESAGANSEIRKEHPEWILKRNGRPAGAGRALDLSQPEVAAWVENEMTRLIQEHHLDLFRLDSNTNDVPEGGNRIQDGYTENTAWRYYEAFYGILGRLGKRFPNVIFENCASGGGRNDLGILRFMHTTWISDIPILPRGLKTLNGITLFLPPEISNRSYGTMWDDQRLYGDLDTQLRVTLFGHPTGLGIGPSAEELNTANARRVRHNFELYKNFVRPMLSGSRVFHHTPVLPFADFGDWCVLEYAAGDSSRAYAGIFRLSAQGAPEYRFKPRGLDLSRRYRVTLDNSGVAIERSGFDLAQQGIAVRLPGGLRSELLLFEAVEDH